MIVACPACATQYRLDPSRLRAGRGRMRCARCGNVFPVVATVPRAATPQDTGPVLRRVVPAAPPTASARLPAPARAAEAFVPPRGAGTRLQVAVVAIEPGELRTRLVGTLAQCGARTVAVDDAAASLDAARRSKPGLLVVGAWLRDRLGWELADAVRAEPALASTRILLVGGPDPGGRFHASAPRVYRVDARVAEDATPAELDTALRLLLDLPGPAAVLPAAEEVRDFSRLVVAELFLYHADAIDAGLRLGRPRAGIEIQIGHARTACVDRFPTAAAAARASVLGILDGELDRALEARRAELAR